MATLKELKYGGGWGGQDTPANQYYFEPPKASVDVSGYTPPAYVAQPSAQQSVATPVTSLRTQKETGGYYPMGTPGASTTTTTRTPTMPMPATPSIPAFQAPTWDEKEIGRLAQKKAAPRLRSLRRQMEREAGRQYENPNVKRMTLRQAMEGYGLGIGSIMSEAESAGRAEYGQKYGREFAGAQTTYAAQTQALMQSYQNAFNAYLQSMQQTTTTGTGGATSSGMVHGGYSTSGKEQFKWADIFDPRRFQIGGV
jgi:hypothetical protein